MADSTRATSTTSAGRRMTSSGSCGSRKVTITAHSSPSHSSTSLSDQPVSSFHCREASRANRSAISGSW